MSAAASKLVSPYRRAMIAKIHIARKDLDLDDADYRTLLRSRTGRASSADCTDAQLADVLDALKAKGWRPTLISGREAQAAARSGAAPVPTRPPRPADSPMARKARAMWISLHQLGVVRDPSERALEAFARRQLGVDKLQWADQSQGYRLIEALKAMAERAGWSQDVGDLKGGAAVTLLKRGLLAAIHRKLGTAPPACAGTALDTAIGFAASDFRQGDPA